MRVDSKLPQPSLGPAQAIVDLYGKRTLYLDSVEPSDYDADPAGWVQSNLLAPTRATFIHALPDLATPAQSAAEEEADRLLDFIEGDSTVVKSRVPLNGLRTNTSLRSGPVRLRTVEPDELAWLIESRLKSLGETELQLRGPSEIYRVILEVDEPAPKLGPQRPAELMTRVVLAMQLLGFEPHGPSHFTSRPGHFGMGTNFTVLRLPEHGSTRDFAQTDLDRTVALALRIPERFLEDASQRWNIALGRFADGCADKYKADVLIDFTIALEAVLLPPSAESELSFRFALYGAHFIATSASERKTLFNEFRLVYGTRSDIVHGNAVKPADLDGAVTLARDLTSRVLLTGLDQGWPTQASLIDRVLS